MAFSSINSCKLAWSATSLALLKKSVRNGLAVDKALCQFGHPNGVKRLMRRSPPRNTNPKSYLTLFSLQRGASVFMLQVFAHVLIEELGRNIVLQAEPGR